MDDQSSEAEVSATATGVTCAEVDRNDVFEKLVTADTDIVGLVAYSIYKQNKYDWLQTFNRMKGREPTEGEAAAYILGESTARRLSTYRHLAQATLEGRGPDVSLSSDMRGPFAMAEQRSSALQRASGNRGSVLVMLALIVIAALCGYAFARLGWPH